MLRVAICHNEKAQPTGSERLCEEAAPTRQSSLRVFARRQRRRELTGLPQPYGLRNDRLWTSLRGGTADAAIQRIQKTLFFRAGLMEWTPTS